MEVARTFSMLSSFVLFGESAASSAPHSPAISNSSRCFVLSSSADSCMTFRADCNASKSAFFDLFQGVPVQVDVLHGDQEALDALHAGDAASDGVGCLAVWP